MKNLKSLRPVGQQGETRTILAMSRRIAATGVENSRIAHGTTVASIVVSPLRATQAYVACARAMPHSCVGFHEANPGEKNDKLNGLAVVRYEPKQKESPRFLSGR